MCVKGHLAICDPMRGSVPRVDEVHFNPQPSMWGATWVRGTSAERSHVCRSWVKLMVLSRSLNFRLTRRITPAWYHLHLPIRPLWMPVINVIKYNCHMAKVTMPVIVTLHMFCQHFHLLKGQKGHIELCEAFSRTPARSADYLQCQRSAPRLLHYPW